MNVDRRWMRSLTTFDSSSDNHRTGRLIPRPDIPVQPVLSGGTFVSNGAEITPAIVDSSHVAYVTSARIAIAHALELANIRPGQKVLVPAFHCIVMVEPILHLRAQPVFYALREDLSVDLDDVATKIDRETCVFIAVNYFGFPQDLDRLRRFCDQHGLVFIEDCAHSFFGLHDGRPLGSFGHFAIGSLPKFFPVRDGGCLVIGSRTSATPSLELAHQDLAANIKAALDTLEEAVIYGRLRALRPAAYLSTRTKRLIHTLATRAGTNHEQHPKEELSTQTGGFNPARMGVRATAIAQAICRCAARDRIVKRRRRNYKRLVQAFSDQRRCRPIFPQLPDGAVPYMFPLWIDQLADIFPILEDRAVPMQRFGQFLWPAMDVGTCKVSVEHSAHLIQLPCDQELTEEELTVLIDRVRTVTAYQN